MSRLDALLALHPSPQWGKVERALLAVVAVFFLWACLAQLEEVASAEGEVVPRGQVRVIQHLEGGIIKAIEVEEGQRVVAGDPLVQLNLAVTGVNYEEMRVRLDGLTLNRARLEAESTGGDLALPPEEAERHPELAKSERLAYRARQRELDSKVAISREKIIQREQEIREAEEKLAALRSDLELNQQKLDISSDLLKSGLSSKLEHIQLEREIAHTRGEIAGTVQAIEGGRARLAEAEEIAREETLKFRREAEEERGRVSLEIARTEELLSEVSDQAERKTITTPIDGTVKNLRYHTIGGVVKPGDPIMEIVPSDEKLVVEAELSPTDRGYVREEQTAQVKIGSYDFIRYGALEGRVTHIAADSTVEPGREPFFRVVVETDRAHLGDNNDPLPITAGMQATVDINTGSKSVLSYLLRPVLKLKHEAFRER